jgi:hypothetical protein
VNLVLRGPTSIRGASGVLSILASQLLIREDTTPSPNSGCNWLLRLGLYELTRPLEQSDDWFWIVDHTVQIGTVKCLLIVGCRLSVWRNLQRPLQHQDLSVIALEPAESSNSDIVLKEFEKSVERGGVRWTPMFGQFSGSTKIAPALGVVPGAGAFFQYPPQTLRRASGLEVPGAS